MNQTNRALPPEQLELQIAPELYENSPDCIKIVRIDGSIARISPGGRVALELDEATDLDGARWPDLWPGSEQLRVQRAIDDGRQGKRSQFSAFCPTAKGTPRWWDVVVTPMHGDSPDSHGDPAHPQVQGLLVVSRDVTELVQSKQALTQANERKDEFLAVLAHELRNPLSALAMAAQVLERSGGNPAELAKVSGLINRQVGHISRLAEDLLDVSRITRDQVDLRLAEIDLGETISEVIDQLASTLSLKCQQCQARLPPHPMLITGDRMRLEQVLGNLIGNASRYAPDDSVIAVTLAREDTMAVIEVIDHGRGIAPDLLPRLFDLYVRDQDAAEREASGLGLGLTIVRGLVALHGGTVQAASAGEERGSTFTVRLPLMLP